MGRLVPLLLLLTLALPATAQATTTTTWKVAVLMYRSVDVTCNGVRRTGSTSDYAMQRATTADAALAARVRDASGGNGALALTYIQRGTLRTITAFGSGYCWPSPNDVALPTGYDSVMVHYDVDVGGTLFNPYAGLSLQCACVNGMTYSTVPIWDYKEDAFYDQPKGVDILAVEWMHGSAGFYRAAGFNIPDEEHYATYGYTNPATYQRKLLGGWVVVNGQYIGYKPNVWGYGTPRSRAALVASNG